MTSSSSSSDASVSAWDGLKQRIKAHYDYCSSYYHSIWGEHIHHGYWITDEETKERAQIQLMELLASLAGVDEADKKGAKVLDVGCGIGGTSRWLAKEHDCRVTGITISSEQVLMARKLTQEAGLTEDQVRFLELDAEKMHLYFNGENEKKEGNFDVVWISEAMSHLPDKNLFFENASKLLKQGGKLVVADWIKGVDLTSEQEASYITPIEEGMLLPPLSTIDQYVSYAKSNGMKVLAEPRNISKNVSKTWDISWSLVQNPSLWAMALTQGRDFVAFLKAFQAMRAGFAEGSFQYWVVVFEKL
eukprot:TRINITY_DN4365_c0_g1_i2.p1 TRINITY_DN4365_c0_g1~~TRINITY_DN4365_c0_g1_i2.p1  ORF type:complete len:312 (+),score=50.86 TRINITY_DN4365_c0_g1_i2:28-936(+)